MNARAAGQAGNVGRRTTRMNVGIQPELFAQMAGLKKCQETRLYLRKGMSIHWERGDPARGSWADGIHHR